MHCFTNIIIATERERKITHSTADVCTGKILPDPSGSFYKVYGVIVMLFDSCSHRKHIRVENNIMRIESNFINQQTICTFAHFYLAGSSTACPFSSKAITTVAAPYCLMIRACSRNTSSPSFREIEFTIDLPCRHFNPASITSHLEESIMTGTRAISGSDMMRFRKVVISVRASSRPSSILTSITKMLRLLLADELWKGLHHISFH